MGAREPASPWRRCRLPRTTLPTATRSREDDSTAPGAGATVTNHHDPPCSVCVISDHAAIFSGLVIGRNEVPKPRPQHASQGLLCGVRAGDPALAGWGGLPYRHVPSGTRLGNGKAAEQQRLQLMLDVNRASRMRTRHQDGGEWRREQRERGKEDNGKTSWSLERPGSGPTRPVLWSRGLHSQGTGRCGRRRRASQANKSVGAFS